jgi:glycerophosphoryl diester phosphodiesterase
MRLLAHRGHWTAPEERNTIESFESAFRHGWGAEIDVRDLDGELVVSHDVPRRGALPFDQALAAYAAHGGAGPLAVNVKSDGLQAKLAEALREVADWFAFDMSVPDALACLKHRLPTFTRHSDVEPDPVLYDRADGVWLDDFAGGWLTEERIAGHVAAGKRVAVVSPELHGREHQPAWAAWRNWDVWSSDRVLLCTDHPAEAEAVFG